MGLFRNLKVMSRIILGHEFFECSPVGREFGDWVARYYIDKHFRNIDPGNDSHCDRNYKGRKVEIKAIRAVKEKDKERNGGGELPICDLACRALNSICGDMLHGLDTKGTKRKLQNVSFQQTKASEFDIFVGFVFFLDKIRIYIIQSNKISGAVDENNGRIKISTQHRNKKEGHLTLNNIPENFLKVEELHENIILKNLDNYLI